MLAYTIGLPELMVVLLVWPAVFLWALIDCLQREFPRASDKIVWILVIVFVCFVGPIVYLVIGRSQGRKGP